MLLIVTCGQNASCHLNPGVSLHTGAGQLRQWSVYFCKYSIKLLYRFFSLVSAASEWCVCGCVLSHGHLSIFFSPAIAWEAEAGLTVVFIQSERSDVRLLLVSFAITKDTWIPPSLKNSISIDMSIVSLFWQRSSMWMCPVPFSILPAYTFCLSVRIW